MKRLGKVLCLALALILAFMLGWRVMPKVWPSIKQNVVYAVLPQLKPEATPEVTPEPYHPKTAYMFEDEIGTEDSVIYYFYKDYCPYCAALEPLTAGLPETIRLVDGMVSTVKLIGLNKVEEKYAAIIADYYEKHAIPEEEQYVPAMVIGDQYLFLGNEIIDGLMKALTEGKGLQTELLNGQERIGSGS